ALDRLPRSGCSPALPANPRSLGDVPPRMFSKSCRRARSTAYDAAAVSLDSRQMPRGRDLLFDALEQQDIAFLFGNPGTTELPLIDGCNEHPRVQYVMALHEDIA